MFKPLYLSVVIAIISPSLPASAEQPRQTTTVDVFVAGVEYPNFRGPSLVAAQDGTLIAIAGGRTGDDPGFCGDTDLVMKRSFDGGLTWSPLQVIENPSAFGEKVSSQNVVMDESNGRVWVLYNRWEGNLGTVDSLPGTTNNTAWARYSDDSGATWSSAIDITMGVKDYNNWNSMAFGPGSGIQATNGRLIVPAARWVGSWNSYVVYSDDNGTTWQRGALSATSNLSNEANVVQLTDGRIRMDARPNNANPSPRVNYLSTNGGTNWGAPSSGQFAVSVHSAVERLTATTTGDDMNRIVWTGPRGPDRNNLVIRTSYDEGSSYTGERLLHDGYSGYSDIEILPNGNIGIFWETNSAQSLTFTTVNQAFLEPPTGLRAYDDFRYAGLSLLGNKDGGYGFSGGWAGAADLSGVANSIVQTSDLAYTNFPFVIEGDRRLAFVNFAGGSMSRSLAAPMDLGEDETYYFSLLVHQDIVGTDEEDVTEQLEFSLLSGTSKVASFGVQGDEAFYVDNAGTRIATGANTLTKGTTYYLVGKIEASAGSFDQIFLSAFVSGDAVPQTEAAMAWTLAGATSMSSSALLDRLLITSGNRATWFLDELRLGTSFGDVVSNFEPTLMGDLDGDGFVGIADLNIVLGAWNQNVPPGNPLADPSGDGFVGIEDLNLVLGNWNTGTPPTIGTPNIPEPSTLGLFVLSGVIFTRRAVFADTAG